MTMTLRRYFLAAALLMIGTAACGGPSTPDPALAYTKIWETVAIAQTQTAQAVSPTPNPTETPSVTETQAATKTPLLTSTPQPGTPSATTFSLPTQAGTQAPGCDNAVGVKDVTYPDYSEVPAGASFLKTWRIENLGPCTWNDDYIIIFGWGGVGTEWSKTPAVHFNDTILPGETLDITVELSAPTIAGTYAGAFRLQNDQGFNFGPEQTVVIVVK